VVGLQVHDQQVGARLDKSPRIAVRLLDHQVHLEGQPRQLAHRLHDLRPERKVGDEVAVHHVEVNGIDLRSLDPLHLLLDLPQIGGEQVGGEADGSHGRLFLFLDQLDFIPFRAVDESDFAARAGDRRPVAQRIALRRGLFGEGPKVLHFKRQMRQVGLHHTGPLWG